LEPTPELTCQKWKWREKTQVVRTYVKTTIRACWKWKWITKTHAVRRHTTTNKWGSQKWK
jgi:hypothetical protein